MTQIPPDPQWRWIAGLGITACALLTLVIYLSWLRAAQCRALLSTSLGGSIGEAAALHCLGDAALTQKIAGVGLAISSLATAVALSVIARRR